MEIPDCFYRISIKALVLNETRDKFLICKEADGRWELPGGGLDWDIKPQEDLPRELMEEMGLKAVWIADNPSYFFTGRSNNHPKMRIANVVYETKLEHLNREDGIRKVLSGMTTAEEVISATMSDSA